MRDLMKMASATLAVVTLIGGTVTTIMVLKTATTDVLTESVRNAAAIYVVFGTILQATVLMTLCVTLETVTETNALLIEEMTRAAKQRSHEAAVRGR